MKDMETWMRPKLCPSKVTRPTPTPTGRPRRDLDADRCHVDTARRAQNAGQEEEDEDEAMGSANCVGSHKVFVTCTAGGHRTVAPCEMQMLHHGVTNRLLRQ